MKDLQGKIVRIKGDETKTRYKVFRVYNMQKTKIKMAELDSIEDHKKMMKKWGHHTVRSIEEVKNLIILK